MCPQGKLYLTNYKLKFKVLYTNVKLGILAKKRSQKISQNPSSIFKIRR